MLLISTTHQPATDLGYLLHKNPSRNFTANLTFGRVHVVFPEATETKATAAVLLELDPVRLVRGPNVAQGSMAQYVNDRPYVASSFASVALADAFGTAMGGRSKERQELADTAIPLEIRIPVLACGAGQERIERLFKPLGYDVQATHVPLDEQFPDWGASSYFDVTLIGTLRLRDALRHLYLLLPVLDARKHYFLDPSEVQKLISKGEGWLADHPDREWIVHAYLGRKPSLARAALEQLANIEDQLALEAAAVDDVYVAPDEPAEEQKPKISLHWLRHERVAEVVRELAPKSVIDLGCGEGKLIRELMKIKGLEKIVGMDVAYYEIEKAIRKLHLDDASPRMRERVQLFHGSLMYRDQRLSGFDACTVVEVIEHLDPPRLAAFEQVVFKYAQPKAVLITTPNREYNAVYELEDQELRHFDHRFEWNREEFQTWGDRVASTYGYQVRYEGIGESHADFGQPSQLAVFTR
ncbi:MAG: 3' terminal RNA ribose 2'-O-methyltransferase Hen1 [Armatimonadetes bacterium]|nr:3' terminal RNA ribose 2'-O-methyltransferase Hen1 [Armatimonadota bacterium]